MPREAHRRPDETQPQEVKLGSQAPKEAMELKLKVSSGEIESTLRELRFHPDFLPERNAEFEVLKAEFSKSVGGSEGEFRRLRDKGHREANLVWNAAVELALIENYFPAKVRFLCELVGYSSGLSAAKPRVADDGCGGGVDIYCLRKKLGDSVGLVGVDPNSFAREAARARNPGIEFLERLGGLGEFDIVYCDFVDWGSGNMGVPEIAAKRDEWSSALRTGGLLIQNVDFSGYERDVYTRILSQSFRLARDERIQKVPDNKDCRLLVFEKKIFPENILPIEKQNVRIQEA